MKILGLLAILFVAGCAARPSMQELETQAMFTGDWSAVNSRERSILRRQERMGTECPNNYIKYCSGTGFNPRCSCINRDSYRLMMGGF